MHKDAHILVVDDDPDTVEILSRQLSLENYKIFKAYSGRESLELLKKHKPDLILMDITMPGMNGFETIRIIRDTVTEFIPIIIVTASKDDTASIARGFAVGANDYIVIPCHKAELLARIKAMLRIKELHDALRESEARYRTLLEASSDLIYVIGQDDTVQYVNPAALRALGRSATEVNGKPRTLFFPPVLAASQKLSLNRVFATGEPLFVEQKTEIGGIVQWQDTHLIPLKDPAGRVDAVLDVSRDITERKRAEQALLLAKNDWEQTFDAVPDLICILNTDHTIRRVNRAMAERLGVNPEETIGRFCYSYMHQSDAPPPFCPHQKLLCDGREHRAELELKHMGGWFDVSASPLRDLNGTLIGSVHVARDITERKKAEDKMLESESLYRTLIETTNTGYVILDTDGKVLEANAAYVCLTGHRDLNEIRGRNVVEWTADYEKAKNAKSVAGCAQKGFIRNLEIDYVDSCGKITPIEINATVVEKDGLSTILTLCRDITKRKQAEEKAVMLADAIDTAHHGCLIISEDYKVVFANDYAFTKIGFDFDELKENDLFSLCADREQVKDIIETVKVTKRWMGEVGIIKKDGGQFSALVSVTALGADDDASGRRGDIILFQDITIQKEMREKLLTSEKLAVMGRLVADVAHEINNPLAIIIGGTQLMLRRLDEKTQTTFKSQLETVLRNARRCKTILANLLGYGRTIGKKEEAVNLPDLIREAIDDVNYQYDMSAIETVLNYGEIAGAEIVGNKSALLSVFVNLIRNARQAMGEKGRLTITIKKEDRKHLRIDIHDTGIGIGREQMVKLFKPFASGWKETESEQKTLSGRLLGDVGEGSGLGLATSLGIVETHGGSMSAGSDGEGKGATFTILLPCEFKRKK